MDFSPKGISRTYYESEARVVKYYENIRLVYEIESRVRELRRAAGTDSNEEKKQEPKDKKQNNSNSVPEQRREQNYSRRDEVTVMADLHQELKLTEPGQYRSDL
jgi:Sec-independent protein translocase protein TatA